jgi:hypothetical protein
MFWTWPWKGCGSNVLCVTLRFRFYELDVKVWRKNYQSKKAILYLHRIPLKLNFYCNIYLWVCAMQSHKPKVCSSLCKTRICKQKWGATLAKYFTCLNVLQVVPPDQARKIYKALKERGLPVALVEYEGEQHGFRKVEYTAIITLHLQPC